MPFDDSLRKESCGVLHVDAEGNPIPCPSDPPKGSGDSSPDEQHMCRCTHPVWFHDMDHKGKCSRPDCGCAAFVPADAEPFACHVGGACKRPEDCAYGCREAADELTRMDEEMEPEAPECKYPGGCPLESDVCPPGKSCAFDKQLKGISMMPRPSVAPPRRPPYAIAYALASGELYEVALPGDAVATVEGGVLKVSHPAGVDRMIQVKPMGTEA